MSNTAKTKKSFVLYKDSCDIVESMTVEQAGLLFKAIYHYQTTGEEKEIGAELQFVLKMFITQFKRDDAKYKKTCAKRSVAGINGAKQKLANAGKCKQKVANQADSDSDSDSDKKIHISCQVMEYYNQVRGEMPKCMKLTATRRSQIMARVKEVGLSELLSVIASCKSMPHLQGKNDRGWTADLEWITKDNNFTKIREGKYLRKKINDVRTDATEEDYKL